MTVILKWAANIAYDQARIDFGKANIDLCEANMTFDRAEICNFKQWKPISTHYMSQIFIV